MTDTQPEDEAEDTVIEFPADVHVFDVDDDLGDVPEADQTGDQTGGMGPL